MTVQMNVSAVLLVRQAMTMPPVAGRSLHQLQISAVSQLKFVVRPDLAKAALLVLMAVRLATCRRNMTLFGLNVRTQAVSTQVMFNATMKVKETLVVLTTEDLGVITGIVFPYRHRRPVW
jgi:hypothetical protein